MESEADNSSELDTSTVTKELEEPSAKQKSTLWWKEKNCPRLKKAMEIWRNPEINGVCDEYPVPRMTMTIFLQKIGSKPITFEN